MCYSAQIWSDYKRYMRAYGADISLKDFYDVFWRRMEDPRIKIPKGMEASFANPSTSIEHEIHALIVQQVADQRVKLEQELFKQRKRLADAQRSLQSKVTKAATESLRIATGKIDATIERLSDLSRTEPLDRDSRIFPGHYAPVMVLENGQRVIKPMRYQCRPAGKPAFHDVKFPGTYNARRDNLEGFWKSLFGYSHGLVVVNAFYENVNRHRTEGRDLREGEAIENLVLEFKPRPAQDMLVACLWSHWTETGEPDLLSFAAITDEPPPEIAAAGHDRCIIAIQPKNVDAWLNPDPTDLAAQHAILEDRAIAFYEHQLAA
jgi:putative SOS response-associated peptidase YedK